LKNETKEWARGKKEKDEKELRVIEEKI